MASAPRIAQERLRLPAMDIARHLVEQDEQGQRAHRRLPAISNATHLRRMDGGAEARARISSSKAGSFSNHSRLATRGENQKSMTATRIDHAATGPTSFISAMRAIAGRARTSSARRFRPGKR